MSDRPGDAELEGRLDEAFASMRPRPEFEDELWHRIARPPVVAPTRRTSWWTWTGAAAAVVLVGAFAFLFAHHPTSSTAGSSASGRAADSAWQPGRAEAFGPLPRPSPSAATVSAAYSPLDTLSGSAAPLNASAQRTDATVIRYREPSPADDAAFAGRLGANGSGARYASSEFTLTFFPTDPALGLPAHYVLTVSAATGAPPAGPPAAAAAQAAASKFLAAHGLPAGAVTATEAVGPLLTVRYSSGTAAYVRGDGVVAQVTGPTGVGLESSGYPLAPASTLQKAAGPASAAPLRLATVLVSDGTYWYLEPVAIYGTFTLPAVDPAHLR